MPVKRAVLNRACTAIADENGVLQVFGYAFPLHGYNADILRKLMQRASIADAGEIIKICDTAADTSEGRNAGCSRVIAETTNAFTREQLQTYHPDHVIDYLPGLPHILFARA